MKLILDNGCDYFTDNEGRKVCRGAKMGRQNVLPVMATLQIRIKLRLEKLKLDGGGYDSGGAYWGYTEFSHIYCAWGNDIQGDPIRIFQWATSRDNAKAQIKSKLFNAVFYR